MAVVEQIRGEVKSVVESSKPQVTRVPITFKEIPLGRPGVKPALAEICRQNKSNKQQSWKKTEPCEYAEKRNIIWLSYGNLDETLAVIELGDGESLDSVEMTESKASLLELVNLLQEKYGSPKKTTNSVENKMGTKFDQDVFVWSDVQGNRITVESIYEKVDRGRVMIESAARVAARGVAEKLVKEVGKSKL